MEGRSRGVGGSLGFTHRIKLRSTKVCNHPPRQPAPIHTTCWQGVKKTHIITIPPSLVLQTLIPVSKSDPLYRSFFSPSFLRLLPRVFFFSPPNMSANFVCPALAKKRLHLNVSATLPTALILSHIFRRRRRLRTRTFQAGRLRAASLQ